MSARPGTDLLALQPPSAQLAALIDAVAVEPVLVVGSPPPEGRDLDLLVRPGAAAQLADALEARGFRAAGRTWVRFAGCDAQVVELIPAADLGLAEPESERLFAAARPLAGLRSLLRPCAHHRLLLAARRACAEGTLSAKGRALVEGLGKEDWRQARRAAPGWGAAGALRDLERALDGEPPRAWRARAAIARARQHRPGALIALSGLDGSGKSTQARGLARALGRLGYPTVEVWTSATAHPLLGRVAAPLRMLLGRSRPSEQHPDGQRPPALGADGQRPPAGEDEDRLARLRERWPWLHWSWVSFVAATNAWWQARAVRGHLLRGRVVICDRYTLDSIVHLRYRYGERHRYRAQLALIRLLSPRPLRAYLLDVSPATAYGRNQEYTPEQNELRARLYRQERARMGVASLDGERSREELCAELAEAVWEALRERRDARPPGRRLREAAKRWRASR
jgi:thymidylate kinase